MEDESGQGTEIWYYDLYYNKLEKLSNSKRLLKFRPSKWNGNNITFYAINLEDASVNIYYLDEDNKIYPLLVDPFNQTDSWSNGSELLVFSEFNGKYFSIYEYNNNEKINLTSSITNDCFYPTYSPDKKIRFFTNYYSEADVFVLKREAIYKQRNN